MGFFDKLKQKIDSLSQKESKQDNTNFLSEIRQDMSSAYASVPKTPQEKYTLALKLGGYELTPGGNGDIREKLNVDKKALDIQRALKNAEDAYNEGVLDAAVLVVELYTKRSESTGKNYNKEQQNIIKDAANRGNYASMRMLLNQYYDGGLGFTPNFDKVVELAKKSIEDRSGAAYLCYAVAMELLNQEQECLHSVNKAIELGYPAAFNLLGTFYLNGRYVDRDLEKAKKCFLQAADHGEISAYSKLGDMELISGNQSAAMNYYQKGAVVGDPLSSYRLGSFKIQEDFELGLKYIKKGYNAGIRRWTVTTQNPSGKVYIYDCRLGNERFDVYSQETSRPTLDEIVEAYAVKFDQMPPQQKFNSIMCTKK